MFLAEALADDDDDRVCRGKATWNRGMKSSSKLKEKKAGSIDTVTKRPFTNGVN